jgi:FKBP-type peptidyl-prolyl cis-trans isomerase 2
MLGVGMLPLGIEEALHIMQIGEERELLLTPDKAFGQIDAGGIIELPCYAVPRAHELEKGMMVEWQSTQAPKDVMVLVADINETTVTLDFNHPLAGESVTYWVTLVDIIDKGER